MKRVILPTLLLVGAIQPSFSAEPDAATQVVYPASATSRLPIAIGTRSNVKPPVPEEENEEYEIETPVGQVGAIRQTLAEIRDAQARAARTLQELSARRARSEKDLDADAILQALDATREELLDAIEQAEKNLNASLEQTNSERELESEPTQPLPIATSEPQESRATPIWRYALIALAWLASLAIWKRVANWLKSVEELQVALKN